MKIFKKKGKFVVKNDDDILLKHNYGLLNGSIAYFKDVMDVKIALDNMKTFEKYPTMKPYEFQKKKGG